MRCDCEHAGHEKAGIFAHQAGNCEREATTRRNTYGEWQNLCTACDTFAANAFAVAVTKQKTGIKQRQAALVVERAAEMLDNAREYVREHHAYPTQVMDATWHTLTAAKLAVEFPAKSFDEFSASEEEL